MKVQVFCSICEKIFWSSVFLGVATRTECKSCENMIRRREHDYHTFNRKMRRRIHKILKKKVKNKK